MIGKRIKEIRKSRHMTQKEFAEMFGVSEAAVKKWEYDEVDPTTGVLITMADKLGCSVDYLLMRTDNASPLIIERDPIKEEVRRYEAFLRGTQYDK
jgi:transcriptional regulator with XRE-family HTH domain